MFDKSRKTFKIFLAKKNKQFLNVTHSTNISKKNPALVAWWQSCGLIIDFSLPRWIESHLGTLINRSEVETLCSYSNSRTPANGYDKLNRDSWRQCYL